MGSLLLTAPLIVYEFENHRALARFELEQLPQSASLPISVAIDGLDFRAISHALVQIPQPEATAVAPIYSTVAGGQEITLQLTDILVQPLARFPLRFDGLGSHDLVRDAVPWLVDTSDWQNLGMRSDGADLRFFAADGATPLRFHIEYGLNQTNTLIWLLQDSEQSPPAPTASFDDQTIIYLAFGDNAGLNLDDPGVLTDSYPALASQNMLLHVRATTTGQILSENEPVLSIPNLAPNSLPVYAVDSSSAPTWQSSTFADLPALHFNGVQQHLLVNGATGLGTGPGRFIVVYRNPDPGSTNWQRLLSARADLTMTDWQNGYASIVSATDSGAAIPQEHPTIHDNNRQNADFSRENFTIGKRALQQNEQFRGEIAEIVGFADTFVGEPRDGLYRYLRRKYNILPRPTAALVQADGLPAFTIDVGGIPVDQYYVDAQGFLRITLPHLGAHSGAPVHLDIQLNLTDGSVITIQDAVWLASPADVWRMQHWVTKPFWLPIPWLMAVIGWQIQMAMAWSI